MILHDYFRSSASYRVRIALKLKGLEAESKAVDLRRGEQRNHAFRTANPQGLVPALETDRGVDLTGIRFDSDTNGLLADPDLDIVRLAQRRATRKMAMGVLYEVRHDEVLDEVRHDVRGNVQRARQQRGHRVHEHRQQRGHVERHRHADVRRTGADAQHVHNRVIVRRRAERQRGAPP